MKTIQILNDKIALVTGSSSGIGRAIALLFAKHGANIIATSYGNSQGGESILKEICECTKGNHLHINCDLRKKAEVKKMFLQIEKKYGRLDILINNAGINDLLEFDDITEENLERHLSTNIKSVIWCTQCACKIMKNRGWIVNSSSFRGLDHAGRTVGYAATKAAINSITRTTAFELAPNILVNAVLPGFTYTPPFEKLAPEWNKKYIEGTLIKRFIMPEEIAGAYLFLVTQEYMTGTLLVADGGASFLAR